MADEELTALIRLESDLAGGREAKREIDSVADAARRADAAQESGANRARAAQDRASAAARSHRRAIDDLGSGYRKFSGHVGSASRTVDGFLANVGTRTVQAGAIGFGALTGWAIKTTSDIEQADIALTTFVGETMGKQLFGQLKELDQMSPFTFPELAQTGQQLAAFGVEAQNIAELAGSISEIASGTGKGVSGMQQLSLALGQVKAAGRLTGDEARQLSEFFNVYKLVGDIYGGKSPAEVKAALEAGAVVPAEVILDAVRKEEGVLQQFQGLNEKQQNTLLGRWASFKSNFQTLIGGNPKTGEKGLFSPLTEEIRNELPAASQDLGDSLRAIAPSLNTAAIAGLRFTSALIPLATPVVAEIFRGIGDGLNAATPGLQALAGNNQIGSKTRELVGEFTDLAIALGPIVRDTTELATNVLPYVVGPLTATVGALADFTSGSRAASIAVGGAITAFLGWRFISPAIGMILKAAEATRDLNNAQAAGALSGAGARRGLAAAGLAGAGALGLYEGAKAEGDLGSALGLVGGGAAAGAALGSVVPVIGTGIGALGGAAAGGIAFGVKKFTGDAEGQWASTASRHAAVEAMTPGSRQVSSGLRNWGVNSSASGHINGTAIDVHGPWMATYQRNVQAAGGWAKQHDSGSGMHVHANYGDVPGQGSISAVAPTMPLPSIQMVNYISQPIDLQKAVEQGILDAQRKWEKRR